MEVLTGLIAQFFDKFKIANPTLAAVVLGILVIANLYSAQLFALIGVTGELADVLRGALAFLSAVIGSRTSAYMPDKEVETTENPK